MSVIRDPRELKEKQKIVFEYNSKKRVGTVERVMNGSVTIKHENPSEYNGKVYSTYMFHRINGRIKEG
jgi:hypothetical protein